MSDVLLAYFKQADGRGRFVLVDEANEYEEVTLLLNDIETESDRGAAIICGAVIESLVSDMLASFFQNKKAGNELLRPSGVLGSLGAKADLLVALGLISSEERSAIRGIQKVRNKFAHIREAHFDDDTIKDVCNSLSYDLGADHSEMAPRDVFLANALNLILEFYDRPRELKKKSLQIEVKRSLKYVPNIGSALAD